MSTSAVVIVNLVAMGILTAFAMWAIRDVGRHAMRLRREHEERWASPPKPPVERIWIDGVRQPDKGRKAPNR